MTGIKSNIFTILFYFWIIAAMILALPFFLFYPVIYKLTRLWNMSILWLLKVIVNCNYRISGLENLPGQGGYIIASKHQSAWDTMVLYTVLPKVVYIYKKELGAIPFYGWLNMALHNIKVDRKAGASALKNIVSQAEQRVNKGYQVVIFPQGTRVISGAKAVYKPAIYAMYKAGLPVYPAALNSGGHWPKHGPKKAGTIIIKFLPQIQPGLSKKEFMECLENTIETESDLLVQN